MNRPVNDRFRATDAIVLRKTEYSESSLIIATFTEDFGRQDFILKGARKSTSRFPPVDLFYHLRTVFTASRSRDLHTAVEVDCIRPNHGLARQRRRLQEALWILRFFLTNTQINNPSKVMFKALAATLSRLAGASNTTGIADILGICFVALSENGMLPSFDEHHHCRAGIKELIGYACDESKSPPAYQRQTWVELANWMEAFIAHTDLVLPKEWKDVIDE